METRLDVIERAAVLADQLGYEVFTMPEGWALDATAVLSALSVRTRQIKLAATILSIWGRTAATLAMAAATMQELSGGRFVLGLGASTPDLAEGFHDTAYEQPVERLREVTSSVRELLQGGRVTLRRVPSARALRLGMAAAPEVPIWHGTVGPRAVRVTAELADGWLPVWLARDGIADRVAELRRIRVGAGVASPLVVTAAPVVVVDPDGVGARASAGTLISWYLCSMGQLHPGFVASQGFEAEVQAVQEANPRITPTTGVIPPAAERLLDQLAVAGAPEDVRVGLDAWDAVADIVNVSLPAGVPWEQIETTIRAAAP
jgi:alkanesulfonate monooxygenase SsuD/methylene tetrahydromethanopterin reductase-like flavin-dependent oxidoreductase (luciferase family)